MTELAQRISQGISFRELLSAGIALVVVWALFILWFS